MKIKEFSIRIWDKKNKQMIYSSESYQYVVSLDGQIFKGNGKSIKDSNNCVILNYTGLKDMNGDEIFEGDIIQDNHDEDLPHIVCWNEEKAIWSLILKKNQNPNNQTWHNELYKWNKDSKIIGNIYEK